MTRNKTIPIGSTTTGLAPVARRSFAGPAIALIATTLTGGPLAADVSRPVKLDVTATGFRTAKGQAIVAVYDSKDSWLKPDRALRLERLRLEGDTVNARFDLPPGTYAVSVIHDENMNGKLDLRYLPFPRPREGAGVSNDTARRVGPPSWDPATFILGDEGGAIEIRIRY